MNLSANGSYITIGSPSELLNSVDNDAAGASGFPALSQIRNDVFQEFTK